MWWRSSNSSVSFLEEWAGAVFTVDGNDSVEKVNIFGQRLSAADNKLADCTCCQLTDRRYRKALL